MLQLNKIKMLQKLAEVYKVCKLLLVFALSILFYFTLLAL